ncbi:MAG: glutathione S-transferase [Rhodobacteraceae bacterium]|nr:glutathione S-transferase [Paracoccaceae bacterium]
MIRLYAIPHSGYCAKVRIALRFKQLDWEELPPPGGYRSERYRRLVPAGNLPALEHDGLLIADSEAICEYLEDAFPEPPLLPSGPADRARMRARARFHDTRLEPALRALYPFVRPAARDPAAIATLAHVLSERLDQASRILSENAGMPFGLGDLAFAPTLAWIRALSAVLGPGMVVPPALRAHEARLLSEPAVKAEMAHFRPAVAGWLASVGVEG